MRSRQRQERWMNLKANPTSAGSSLSPGGANLTDGPGRQPDIPNFDSGWFLDIDFGTSLTTKQRRIQF